MQRRVTKESLLGNKGSVLVKVLKHFSLGKNHLLYLFKKSLHSFPRIAASPLFFSFFLSFYKRNVSEGACLAGFLSGRRVQRPSALSFMSLLLQLLCSMDLSSYSPPHIAIYDMHNHLCER